MKLRYAVALILWCAGCGGSDSGGGLAPTAAPSAKSDAADPCAEVGALAASGDPDGSAKRGGWIGDTRDVLDSLWLHRTRKRVGVRAQSARSLDEDRGDIAVLRDDGTIVTSPNTFDLRGQGLRFQPNAAGGYDVAATGGEFRSPLGSRLTLADDGTSRVDVPFAFPFFGRSHTAAFVNSDGNLTFSEGDVDTTERGLGRLLRRAPRVAPFFADLDPTSGGGVFAQASAGALTVTWCSVPGFGSPRRVTTQATLLPDGSVEMKFGDSTTLASGIVGLSPGRGASFVSADLSAPGPSPGGTSAVGERFAERPELDVVALAQRFYETHGDEYDQLVVFGDAALIAGEHTFAFEQTVRNDVQGIGLEVFDHARDFGSGGALESVVVMDALGKYPDHPDARVPNGGENTTLSILGQECGHRWLAFLRFRDATGRSSSALLGRDLAHWSFFFDSDASVMEGNDIEDLGGGSFRTVGTVSRYSLLDLYGMGVVGPAEVPPFFYVADPAGATERAESGPKTGVTFTGTRRDVTIQDVVAAMGPRRPSVDSSPRVHRQAFAYVLSIGRTADPAAEVAKLDGIRQAWVAFFARATGERMAADTRLR